VLIARDLRHLQRMLAGEAQNTALAGANAGEPQPASSGLSAHLATSTFRPRGIAGL
jgi:hypothetical protein